ncbi:MAG: hypothetical protein AAFV45_14070 [Pseudomonadota bacterium]
MVRDAISSGCRVGIAAVMAVMLAACASDGGGGGGGPYAKPLASGQSCGAIRSELRRLDNRGVPSKVERLNAGKSLSSKDRQLAQRYNKLLNDYLGARCHV